MRRSCLALLALAACSPPPSAQETEASVERCVLEGNDAPQSRAVEIGALEAGGFQPYQDGQDLELVWGMQGGVMITPAIRVEGAADDPSRVCVSIRFTHALIEGDAPGLSAGVMLQAWLDRTGDDLVSGTIDDLLEFDPEPLADEKFLLTAIVDGPLAGTTAVEVVLRAP
jgi:hypothetical protein